jgi:hypothetical protein
MTDKFAKKVGLKLFSKHLEQYTPTDPLYETYVTPNGKTKRRKRQVPPGLSKRDEMILKSVKSRAHYLDKGFKICGMQFGWTVIIGLIPLAGDVVDASLNYFLVLRKCKQAELPDWLIRQMLLNNVISAGVGAIPFVGDVILGIWKANSRNAALLEEFLRVRGAEFLKLEAARVEDESVVKPGAGREKGEKVEGKAKGNLKSAVDVVLATTPSKQPESTQVQSGSSFFGSLKKRNTDKGKAKA